MMRNEVIHSEKCRVSAMEYLYNSKELQDDKMISEALNLYDYGARFFDPQIGRWHVIDNKVEKYYSISPYVYAINLPVKFIDPDGKDIYIWYPGCNQHFVFTGNNASSAPNNPFVKSVIEAYNYNIFNGGGDNLKEAASNPDLRIEVRGSNNIYSGSYSKPGNDELFSAYVRWYPDEGYITENGNYTASPATVLEEEFDHAVHSAKFPKEHIQLTGTEDTQYGNKEERRVAEGSVAKTGQANKEFPKGQTKESHSGTRVKVDGGPTSTKINKAKSLELIKEIFIISDPNDKLKHINNIENYFNK